MDFMTNQVRLCVVKRERTVLFLCILSVNCRKQAFFINLKSEAISYIIMYTHRCEDRIKSNLTCKAGLEYLTVVLCILLLWWNEVCDVINVGADDVYNEYIGLNMYSMHRVMRTISSHRVHKTLKVYLKSGFSFNMINISHQSYYTDEQSLKLYKYTNKIREGKLNITEIYIYNTDTA